MSLCFRSDFGKGKETIMKSHRELAEQLDLFHSEPDGPGMVFWHPNGWRLFQSVQKHMRDIYSQHGFVEINTPVFLKKEIWRISGHLEKFSENMFFGGELGNETEYALKPMSCPGHILIFRRGVYSYRDLPFRVFEFGTVHRNEPSGSINGCFRLRQFTQDDAHVFCLWSQAEAEIQNFLLRAKQVYGHYGYDSIAIKISTRPENAFGNQADWGKAEHLLASACSQAGYSFEYQIGEGAFYGPKIELSLKDGMGREWQCGTIQLDFNLPERFDVSYVDETNQRRRPVILHQAMYGSIERWIAILLESCQGRLPPWVHPVPVALASINERVKPYSQAVEQRLKQAGIPCILDDGNQTISRKIKEFHKLKVPYIIVIGDREMESRSLNLRSTVVPEQREIVLKDLVSVLKEKLMLS
jgi:threonyl-tRNA synthetase